MKNLEGKFYNPHFSHIYIEKEAINHPNTKKIIKYFNNSKIITINHYKDIFSRSHQNYRLQKKSRKLILAIKKENLLYKGAKVCENFGNDNFYYTSTIMNCIYDCEYCYLQGMYSSAHIVIFVNIEDIFTEVKNLLKKHPIYLCISYDTDILAFENILGYTRKWINFANKHNKLKIELRTKSNNFKAIEDLKPNFNFIIAFTISPDEIIENYEHKTPSLINRLESIKMAIKKGWNVRICFDPVIYVKEWKKIYSNMIEKTFDTISGKEIYDVSIGVFRVSKEYIKRIRKQRKNSIIINYPFVNYDGIYTYSNEITNEMISYLYNLVKKYVDSSKIYI